MHDWWARVKLNSKHTLVHSLTHKSANFVIGWTLCCRDHRVQAKSKNNMHVVLVPDETWQILVSRDLVTNFDMGWKSWSGVTEQQQCNARGSSTVGVEIVALTWSLQRFFCIFLVKVSDAEITMRCKHCVCKHRSLCQSSYGLSRYISHSCSKVAPRIV